MAPQHFAYIQPHLRLVPVGHGHTLITPHTPFSTLFFPESGFTSVTTEGAGKVEVGIIGREGLVGATPFLLGSDQTPYEHFIQAPGEVLAIAAEPLRASFDGSEPVRRLLLRYIQTFIVQTTQTAFINATVNVEARLARWLLMCQDRLGTQEFAITHEFISMMLGVQRTSVTGALQILEGNRLIKARRGQIEIRDREKLIQTAGDAYGVPEAEYARLIGED